jgi:transketolase
MGAILNGSARRNGALGATFPFFRLHAAADSPCRVDGTRVYVFTHDSIALGEDGSTHQPVEQLAGLRSVRV